MTIPSFAAAEPKEKTHRCGMYILILSLNVTEIQLLQKEKGKNVVQFLGGGKKIRSILT